MKFKQALMLVGVVAVGTGFVISAVLGTLMYTGTLSTGDSTTIIDGEDGETDTSGMTSVDRVNLKANFGYEVTSGDAWIFKSDMAPESERPEHYGDYVDFNSDEATSGLRSGKDYYHESFSNASEVTFSNVPADQDYTLVVEDGSDTRVIHDYFSEVSAPAQVASYKTEGSSLPDVYLDSVSPTAVHTVNEDTTQILDIDQEGVAYGTDLGISESKEDMIRYVKRSVTVQNGEAYLGSMTFENISTGDITQMKLVETTTDGSQVEDASDVELYNSVTGVDEIGDNGKWFHRLGTSDDPAQVADDVTFLVKLRFDSGTGSVSNDDGTLQDGEEAMVSVMRSIYDNKLADGSEAITG